ncbi:hypothetical protein IRJ41_002902 [Triplophysa rosa]|uniref:Uncharacterized protein n=1 Tax=Triplophysa rosa TaxID=992332 RepID=A0A9W8CA10_TRIRA|nr:hypothetical protein IRJ41_002902 [Triplophysa rosa]
MQLKNFLERDTAPLHKDVAVGLTQFEQKLCAHFSRVEIRGKKGRKVAVLLSPDIVDALTLLISRRQECGVPQDNTFLFARPRCLTPYRGQDCLRIYADECGAQNPELLRSTQLRKHVATLSQILNLRNHELDQVADFLGHDIRVHREYYRLPEATTQLAKISKLLLAMEKGSLTSLQGKTLEEIDIEGYRGNSCILHIYLSCKIERFTLCSFGPSPLTRNPQLRLWGCQSFFSSSLIIRGYIHSVYLTGLGYSPLCPTAAQHFQTPQSPLMLTCLLYVTVFYYSFIDADPASEGPSPVILENPAEKKDARRKQKQPWSPTEIAAVMRHFKSHITQGKLATKIDCQQCKNAEHPALSNRSLQNIRDFVRNRGLTLRKRQAQNT